MATFFLNQAREYDGLALTGYLQNSMHALVSQQPSRVHPHSAVGSSGTLLMVGRWPAWLDNPTGIYSSWGLAKASQRQEEHADEEASKR
jgi:hypothetical protein